MFKFRGGKDNGQFFSKNFLEGGKWQRGKMTEGITVVLIIRRINILKQVIDNNNVRSDFYDNLLASKISYK